MPLRLIFMGTPEFAQGLEELIGLATQERVAMMCAEAVPWRCHRSLIGDALFVHGIRVRHIMSAGSSKDHTLTPWAKVKGRKITYPPERGQPGTGKD